MRQNIEQIVAARFGNRSVVIGVQRSRYAYIGSYDCDLITVQLSERNEFRLFLKDYRVSQKSKDEPTLRRERELRVNRDLLSQTELGRDNQRNPIDVELVRDGAEGAVLLVGRVAGRDGHERGRRAPCPEGARDLLSLGNLVFEAQPPFAVVGACAVRQDVDEVELSVLVFAEVGERRDVADLL